MGKLPRLLHGRRAHFQRLGGFTLAVVINGLVSTISIPLLVTGAGLAAWGTLAAGQAVGTIAAMFLAWGWAVIGPAEVAGMGPLERGHYFRVSVAARLLLVFPVIAVTAVCAATVSDRPTLCSGMAVAVALSGLSSSWFFVGSGDTRSLLLMDTAPRAASNAIGGVAVAAGAPPVTFPALLGTLTLLAAMWSARRVLKATGDSRRPVAKREVTTALRRQSPPLAASLLASAYTTVPLIMVAALAPSATPVYAMADRFLKLALTAISPLAQYMQSWVPTRGSDLRRRITLAVSAMSAVGVVAGLVFLIGAPIVGGLLSAQRVDIPLLVALALGAALSAATVSQTIGLACLVPLGWHRTLLVATAVGAPVSLFIQWAFVPTLGATAAALSVALSELAVLVVELVALRWALVALSRHQVPNNPGVSRAASL